MNVILCSVRIAVTLTVFAALLFGETHVIDLIDKPSHGHVGSVGGRGGGTYDYPTFGRVAPAAAPEPVPLSIESFAVQSAGADRFIGEIILRNTGKQKYLFPVGRDASLLRTGRRNKRQIALTDDHII